jgi:hypothetical protein
MRRYQALLSAPLFMAVSLFSNFSYAGAVTLKLISNVTESNSRYFGVGDVFEWTVGYQEFGTYVTIYQDGPDDIARTSDDRPSGGFGAPFGHFAYLSNAVFDLPNAFPGDKSYYDRTNWAAVATVSGNLPSDFQITGDGAEFGVYGYSGGVWTNGRWRDYAGSGEIKFQSRLAPAPVPLPSSISLFCIGLGCLGLVNKNLSAYRHKNRI